MSTPPPKDAEVRARMRRLSRRGFAFAGLAAAGGWAGLRHVTRAAERDGIPGPLRDVLSFNERLWSGLPGAERPTPEFPASAVVWDPRVNGMIGLPDIHELQYRPSDEEFDGWRVEVSSPRGRATFSMKDLSKFPTVKTTTEMKCVEGWSTVVSWTGLRLADFASMTGLATRSGRPVDLAARPEDVHPYVGLETPGGEYYVGLDAPSAFNPLTVLALQINGRPLTLGHGGPIRLSVPVKYGVKSLKRVGSIRFGEDRPRDYWAERGYDWYLGL